MRTMGRLLMTTLVATAALAAFISSASARDLSVSAQNIRVAWSSVEFNAGVTIRCGLTLEGSFHSRTIVKTARSLVGYITAARFRRPCTGGTMWAYNGTEVNEVLGNTVFGQSLPWHITYESFTGTLPTITRLAILLSSARYRIRAIVLGIAVLCDYTSGAEGNITGTATRNTTTGVVDNLILSGRIRSETAGCPELTFGSMTADGILTVLNSAAKITVTLI